MSRRARRPVRLSGGDRDLLASVDASLADAAGRAGEHLACRPGCSECCIGPFPINRLDARRLRLGLAELAGRDLAAAAAIASRAREALQRMRDDFPGDAVAGRLSGDEAAEDRFFDRPLSCRTYGPPVRIRGEDLPPCRLCFTSAGPGVVEACRVEPDPRGLEQDLLQRLVREEGDPGETVIAYVVADVDGSAGSPQARTRPARSSSLRSGLK